MVFMPHDLPHSYPRVLFETSISSFFTSLTGLTISTDTESKWSRVLLVPDPSLQVCSEKYVTENLPGYLRRVFSLAKVFVMHNSETGGQLCVVLICPQLGQEEPA